jgi:hypothetical protein
LFANKCQIAVEDLLNRGALGEHISDSMHRNSCSLLNGSAKHDIGIGFHREFDFTQSAKSRFDRPPRRFAFNDDDCSF